MTQVKQLLNSYGWQFDHRTKLARHRAVHIIIYASTKKSNSKSFFSRSVLQMYFEICNFLMLAVEHQIKIVNFHNSMHAKRESLPAWTVLTWLMLFDRWSNWSEMKLWVCACTIELTEFLNIARFFT